MRWFVALAILAGIAHATDPAFYLRGTSTNQSIGGLNGNLLDTATMQHDRLTKVITPPSCPAGQALGGAFFNNGYTFGGVCGAGTFTATVSIGTMTISAAHAPPNNFALCLSAGQLGHCTTTPTNGACTCVAP